MRHADTLMNWDGATTYCRQRKLELPSVNEAALLVGHRFPGLNADDPYWTDDFMDDTHALMATRNSAPSGNYDTEYPEFVVCATEPRSARPR